MDLKQETQLTVMVDSNNVSAGIFWGDGVPSLEDEPFPFGTLRPICRGYVKLVPRRVSLIFVHEFNFFVTICFTLIIQQNPQNWRHFEDPQTTPGFATPI